MGSILYSTSTPSFDSSGQFTLISHSLLSSQLSLSTSFSPSYSVLLPTPPTQPYHSQQPVSSNKRNRIKLDPQFATPADWHRKRQLHEKLLDSTTTTDKEGDDHHQTIAANLQLAVDDVTEGWLDSKKEGQSWLGDTNGKVEWIEETPTEAEGEEVNWVARLERIRNLSPQDSERTVLDTTSWKDDQNIDSLFERIVHNSSSSLQLLQCSLSKALPDTSSPTKVNLVIPSHSAFLISDFNSWSSSTSGIANFGAERGGWDFLILDPPWPNKSVSRSSSYSTFDPYDLWKLDVKALLRSTKPCLIAIWVTNKVKFRRLIIDKLFPSWGISQPPAEWYWIKIASNGEPVWKLESNDRRCYEGLILGYYNPSSSSVPSLPLSKIFLSTPLGHSRKPILLDILKPFLPEDKSPNVLELFSRTAVEGGREVGEGVWLAVGNEAVRFNTVEGVGEGCAKGWLVRH